MDYLFQTADYIVCVCVIMMSVAIGIYYACSGGKQSSTLEYHLGNRKLKMIPVLVSLLVTHLSAISLIGLPAEVYQYGVLGQFTSVMALDYLLASRVVVPLMYRMKITSVNEYFEHRYKTRHVRFFMTFLGSLFMVLYLGIITYGLSVAIESVTKIPVWVSILAVAGSSMIYVSLGGIKAVVWTDVFQFFMIITATVAVVIKGSILAGGASHIWKVNVQSGRMYFDFSIDPTVRYTVWGAIIGGSFKLLGVPFTQMAVQRIGCMPTIRDAYRVYRFLAPSIFIIISLLAAQGFVAYAYFQRARCDPIEAKILQNANQLIPYMVVRIFHDIPGMSGVFIAGLLAAALSTISSGYSALSAIVLQDIVRIKFKSITEFQATVVSKIVVVVCSITTTGMAFLMAQMKGTLIQLASVILSLAMAPSTGVFLYSIFCTRATTAGAFAGGIASLILYAWLSFGQIFTKPPNLTIKMPPAPIDMCWSSLKDSWTNASTKFPHLGSNLPMETSVTMVATANSSYHDEINNEGSSGLYTMSFMWFDVICIAAVIVVGSIFSLIAGQPKSEDVDVRYILCFTEQFFPFLPKRVKYILSCGSDVAERRARLFREDKKKGEQEELVNLKQDRDPETVEVGDV